MPTYDYECEECGIVFERFQRFSEEPIKVCPECNGPVHRIIHPVGIIFKGSGWYVTDHRSDTSASTPKAKSGGQEGGQGKKGEEGKPATETAPKPEPTKKD